MWFGFNPAVNFCHFSILLTLSFFAGATSTSPKFDLYLYDVAHLGVHTRHQVHYSQSVQATVFMFVYTDFSAHLPY